MCSETMNADIGTAHRDPDRRVSLKMPASPVAWWSVGLTVAIFPIAWVLMSHAIDWAILDTAFAPVLLVSVILGAAVTGIISWRTRGERSFLLIAALVISIPLAIYGTLMLGLEALFPH